MQRRSYVTRNELFIAAAIVAAHSNQSSDGFRQRDVRFLAELFFNWSEVAVALSSDAPQNTQLIRYLEKLGKEGILQIRQRGKSPRYKLTRGGIIELLRRMQQHAEEATQRRFLFLLYFLHSYKERLIALATQEDHQFPPALLEDLHTIVDTDTLLRNKKAILSKQIRALEERIRSANEAASFVESQAKGMQTFSDVVKIVERKFPYQLNSQKPLSELVGSIPQRQQLWELTHGHRNRAALLWNGQLLELKSSLELIDQLGAISQRLAPLPDG